MMNKNVHIRSFDSIRVGEEASLERLITESDVLSFAQLSGDHNSLHVDREYAEKTMFGKRIVHGMFLGSLISQIIGMQLPGKYSLLLKESLEFKKPALIGDDVTVSAIIKNKSEVTKIVELQLFIKKGTETLVTGSAMVKVLS